MELLFKDEVYAIVGAAIEVHREMRNGFLEAVYQEALQIELTTRNIPHIALAPINVHYKGHTLKKFYVADFVCYGSVLVEIKVMDHLTTREEAQLLNYMNATRMRVGLLINFGDAGRLDWQRFIL